MATEIKKGLICTDEQKTKGIYPYTSMDCVFDENGDVLEDVFVSKSGTQTYDITGTTFSVDGVTFSVQVVS